MCGPVRDSPGGTVRKIIAAGGDPPTDKVEVYDISTNTWETGMYRDALKGGPQVP